MTAYIPTSTASAFVVASPMLAFSHQTPIDSRALLAHAISRPAKYWIASGPSGWKRFMESHRMRKLPAHLLAISPATAELPWFSSEHSCNVHSKLNAPLICKLAERIYTATREMLGRLEQLVEGERGAGLGEDVLREVEVVAVQLRDVHSYKYVPENTPSLPRAVSGALGNSLFSTESEPAPNSSNNCQNMKKDKIYFFASCSGCYATAAFSSVPSLSAFRFAAMATGQDELLRYVDAFLGEHGPDARGRTKSWCMELAHKLQGRGVCETARERYMRLERERQEEGRPTRRHGRRLRQLHEERPETPLPLYSRPPSYTTRAGTPVSLDDQPDEEEAGPANARAEDVTAGAEDNNDPTHMYEHHPVSPPPESSEDVEVLGAEATIEISTPGPLREPRNEMAVHNNPVDEEFSRVLERLGLADS